jgi:hypothetical protein
MVTATPTTSRVPRVNDQSSVSNPATVPRAERRVDPRVEGAIAQASARTGIDFGYLMAQAKVESSFDADAKASTSSASGLYQFIESTWLNVMQRHGASLGYGQLAAAIEQGPKGPRVADPLLRGQILALRNDPQAASLMAGALAQDNRDALVPVLGREPDAGELYLAHFLGSGGAGQFLTALAQRPGAPAAIEFPKAASANRAIFYAPGGGARSFAEVMTLLRGKIERAMPDGGPLPQYSFAAAQPARGNAGWGPFEAPPPLAGQGSPVGKLSDMLRASFGTGPASGAAGDHARRAYEKLKAFGL